MATSPLQNDWGNKIISLVSMALTQENITGLSKVLKEIAKSLNAVSCILWQLSPKHFYKAEQLCFLAGWFKNENLTKPDKIPLDASVTGIAVKNNKPQKVTDPYSNIVYYDSFLTEIGVTGFCSIPIMYDNEIPGALNFYRNDGKDFSDLEIQRAELIAKLVPLIYSSLRDKVGFALLSHVDAEIQKSESWTPKYPPKKKDTEKVVQKICMLVSNAFQCLETSVFLEDPFVKHGAFKLAGTTWPRGQFKKDLYYGKKNNGMTGWVLLKKKPVSIPDLLDVNWPLEEYPGLIWKDSLDIAQAVRKLLKIPAEGDLPPLSFMAVPIKGGKKIHGVIRCSVTRQEPFFFAQREVKLLSMVAAHIGRYWDKWLSWRTLQDENISLQKFVKSIRELNSFVHNELGHPFPREEQIFSEALKLTSDVIERGEITDIRMVDEESNELFFTAVRGDAWKKGTPEEITQRRNRRFSAKLEKEKSAGAYVLSTGKVYEIKNVNKDPYYSETFLDTKKMIVAPVVLEVKDSGKYNVEGVLDIRGTENRDFPDHARPMAALIGSQLSLYRFLTKTINNLRDTVTQLKRIQEERIQVFTDMHHQLKTPINQVHARVGQLLNMFSKDENEKVQYSGQAKELRDLLWAIRGLSSKAKRVSFNMRLFVSLASGEDLKINKSRLYGNDILKLLIESGQDNRLIINPSLGIKFYVEPSGFNNISPMNIDAGLFEQAITCILENAFKYSYKYTLVKVLSKITRTGRFAISFINEGIPISPNEVSRCKERGWQSESAQAVSMGGRGIGLWIVDHIMDAHMGNLVINPTSSKKTEIMLIFPGE